MTSPSPSAPLPHSVVGAAITGVRYLVSATEDWPSRHEDRLIHEVDHGIELVASNDRTLLPHWEMREDNGFLSIDSTATEAGVSFVVALGEFQDGILGYMPDEVVALFDREISLVRPLAM